MISSDFKVVDSSIENQKEGLSLNSMDNPPLNELITKELLPPKGESNVKVSSLTNTQCNEFLKNKLEILLTYDGKIIGTKSLESVNLYSPSKLVSIFKGNILAEGIGIIQTFLRMGSQFPKSDVVIFFEKTGEIVNCWNLDEHNHYSLHTALSDYCEKYSNLSILQLFEGAVMVRGEFIKVI